MMIDDNIVAVSPATTYRILKAAGLLNRWSKVKRSTKGRGFDQPIVPHQHWHTDIKYVNFHGTFLFFISVTCLPIGRCGMTEWDCIPVAQDIILRLLCYEFTVFACCFFISAGEQINNLFYETCHSRAGGNLCKFRDSETSSE